MNVPEILKSKRFWSAVVGLVILVLSSVIPQLEAHLSVIAPSVIAIVGILIGGYSIEETAQAYSAGKK